MTLPATRFLTGGRTRLIGTSLGSPTGVELPNSAMFWPAGVTAGWPAGDLAGYNRVKDMWGRAPDTVRLYWNGPFATRGVSGSAGTYGAFGAHQAIVNFFLDNCIGYGPKPATGHGSAWAGTWYDMLEWCHVGIGADMGANNGASYAYYPGDGFAQWVFGDIFNWSGGYPDSPG